MNVRTVRDGDAAAVAAVYNHYVEHTVVTFEESPRKFDRWIDVGYWQRLFAPPA